MSDTCDTLVPEAAPRYSTLPPGLMWMLSTPASTEAASLDLNGFQTLYSVFSPSAASTLILFSLYTLHDHCTMVSMTNIYVHIVHWRGHNRGACVQHVLHAQWSSKQVNWLLRLLQGGGVTGVGAGKLMKAILAAQQKGKQRPSSRMVMAVQHVRIQAASEVTPCIQETRMATNDTNNIN